MDLNFIDPNKVYSTNELEKNSRYPLFESFFINENPSNLEIYHNYQNARNANILDTSEFSDIEFKYKKLLPDYFHLFDDVKVVINKDDDITLDFPIHESFINALKIFHGIKRKISKSELSDIIQKDTKDFFAKFNRDKMLGKLKV